MQMTDVGVEMVKMFEGLRLRAYQDSVGVWTIGYGHTNDVKEGDEVTLAQAEGMMRVDLYSAEDAVRSIFKDTQLAAWEADALISFAFNLGGGALRSSTLAALINGGVSRREVAPQFNRWIYGGGKPLLGLKRRRFAEAVRFLGGDFPMVSMAYHGWVA